MAGYTRQSAGSIINGLPITAPPLNAEFNQVAAAFNATTGHGHTGGAGDAQPIALATSVSGYLPAAHGGVGGKNNLAATSNPTATNDAGQGYSPGSMWENTTTGRVFICVGNTSNAAVWRELVQVETSNKIVPQTTNTVDIGTSSNRYKNLYLSGGATVAGTLNVTGDAGFANLAVTGTTTITSVDLNSGAIDNTVIGNTTPVAGSFTTLSATGTTTLTTVDINGGAIDGTTIGASTPAAITGTTITSTGLATLATVDVNGGAIDATVIGASTAAAGSFTTVSTSGQATLATVDINGGSIDGTIVGATTPVAVTGTTITGTSLVGPLTGTVAGNVTGNVLGNLTGNVAGNVTASSGTSSFTDVTINGTLNMNAGTTATITNLSAPVNPNDAARKVDVDTAVSNLVDSAPGTLDTLNELSAALGDDSDFANTITTSIATKLPLAGGTMTGAIAMGTSKITGLGDPTANQDAMTKAFSDTTYLGKAGGTMTGAIDMGSQKITTTYAPVNGLDLTNKTYVDTITGSLSSAQTNANNAAASATAAATSETNAGNSATAAASSATSAAASYDSFDDRYLGAKSSAPSVDNDGDALIAGALYFNTTTDIMYVYGGSGWQAAGSSVNGTSSRNTYTATAGQTAFASTYDPGFVDAYLNGVKLISGTDFTATSGTSIVLTTGAALGDTVDIVAYGTFVVADTYTKTQADARYLLETNNLSDLDNASTARTNLGVSIGSDVQAYDANLPAWPSTVDATEVGYLNGVTSAIQTQIDAKMTPTYTGDVNITGEFIADSYNETYAALSGTSPAVNCETGNSFSLVLSGNTTFTFTNPPASGTAYTFSVEIIQNSGGSGYSVTWPSSVDWPAATAPTLTADANAKDIFVFTTRDGGTNWYGFTAGQALG
jgi:hypothetical protein